MRIAADAEIKQITNGLVRTLWGDDALSHKPTQNMGNFHIQQVWRVQGFVTRTNPMPDSLSRGCLDKPIYCCRGIQDDQRSSRPCRTRSAVSISAEIGCRRWRRA
jgi:hypothetical protein